MVFWGSNIVETWPVRYHHPTRPAKEKGAKMVAINPIFNPTAANSDEWLPIRHGTDTALALGMINMIISEGLQDEAFIIEHTVGPFLVRSDNGLFLRKKDLSSVESGKYTVWDTKTNQPQPYDQSGVIPALKGSYRVDGVECKPAFELLAEMVKQYTLEKVSGITEITPDAIRRLALDYATLKPAVSERGIGLSRTYYGDLMFRAISTLAAITGNICLKKAEQDIFPALNFGPFIAPAGRMYKEIPSFQFYDNHLTVKPYPIKAFWGSSSNPANSHPNSNNIRKLLSSMEFIVVVDLFMSATADLADIVLPGCTSFECTGLAIPWLASYGGHSYLQMQPKVIERYYESKSDMEIFTELAQRMGLGQFFDKNEEEYLEMLLSSGHPSIEGITLDKLREQPMKLKPLQAQLSNTPSSRVENPKEPGQKWASYMAALVSSPPLFSTPSRKLEFYSERMKEFGQELPVYIEPPESARQPLAQKYPLSILYTHSKSRHHSDFGNVAYLRELDPEPVLNMNPVDAAKRSIGDGDMVLAFNDRGRVKVKARIHEGIRPGVVSTGEGWQPRDFVKGSYQELTGPATNRAQQAVFGSVGYLQGVLVEVKKA